MRALYIGCGDHHVCSSRRNARTRAIAEPTSATCQPGSASHAANVVGLPGAPSANAPTTNSAAVTQPESKSPADTVCAGALSHRTAASRTTKPRTASPTGTSSHQLPNGTPTTTSRHPASTSTAEGTRSGLAARFTRSSSAVSALVSCHSTAATTSPPTAQPNTTRSTLAVPRSAGVSPGTSASTAPTQANGPTTSAALITQPAVAASNSLPSPGQLCERYRAWRRIRAVSGAPSAYGSGSSGSASGCRSPCEETPTYPPPETVARYCAFDGDHAVPANACSTPELNAADRIPPPDSPIPYATPGNSPSGERNQLPSTHGNGSPTSPSGTSGGNCGGCDHGSRNRAVPMSRAHSASPSATASNSHLAVDATRTSRAGPPNHSSAFSTRSATAGDTASVRPKRPRNGPNPARCRAPQPVAVRRKAV
jgi:hypothetical protein